MRLRTNGLAIGLLSYLSLAAAQTYTDCNPLKQTCPADPALGRSADYDFTQGGSDDFTEVMSPTYGSDGAEFTVSKQGQSPLIQSNWYIMFGHVEFVIKAAPGTGIVSSAVLQSDNLDEIDWEWLGGNNDEVQTNYFGKGNTETYNRAASHENSRNQNDFHTYTIDWTSSHIVWQIDGTTVRVLTPDTAETDQYPQSPMMVKVGVWAGGDPSNDEGTIQWAGGETDFSAGPFTMYLKSLSVTDYSTGTSYSYGDKSGTWQSIVSEGGEVNGNSASQSVTAIDSVPSITATADSGPIPFEGTHRETTSHTTPNIYPWVPRPSSDEPDDPAPSLPDGWNFAGTGKTQPPSRSSMSEHCPQPRFISLSKFMLKRCLPPTQSTLPSTSASHHSWSGFSSPSGLESTVDTQQSVILEAESVDGPAAVTEDIDNVAHVPEQGSIGVSHLAPTTSAANVVFDASVVQAVLCALLSGVLVYL
ncbi:concanavalin A-like lectin/glucanase domain-containing protein [Aspergillus karnatakaensis]|uniref:glycoside hydrolase family 16 protein n=1 Tax=Aspergillus karnatakaensis TaxID=1810916 RepID=UPI003CCD345E